MKVVESCATNEPKFGSRDKVIFYKSIAGVEHKFRCG